MPYHVVPKLGTRTTRQRTAVIDVLDTLDTFASAKTIYDELQHRKERVGLTTVYRTLQSLADMGAVDVLHVDSGETCYRRCTTSEHHHHLVCTACHDTIEIDGGPVERWAQETTEAHGYTLTTHTVEIFGLCPRCQEN